MPRFLAAGLLAFSLAATLLPAAAQDMEDETRDRVLLLHQSRGTLAPGTRPKCFPPSVNETVARSQFQCPWERPTGRPRYPSARSLWGLFGNY